MLKGCDVSHYQKNISKELLQSMEFVIFKVTEGKKSVDSGWKLLLMRYTDTDNLQAAADENRLVGFYHYARPEYNDAISEADNFIKQVSQYPGPAVYALDWEGNALKYSEKWIIDWCNRVQEATGVKPMVYMSDSNTKRYPNLVKHDIGLWDARWGKKPNPANWSFWAIWQYKVDMKSKPNLDLDYFNGTAAQWNKYASKYPN